MTVTNRVILTGRVMKPPLRSFRPDGSSVIEFPLELNDQDPSSTRKGRSLVAVVAFGKLAETEFDQLQSGQQVEVEGRLKQRHWQTPEGRNRTRLEVIATDLRRVDSRKPTERGEKDEETR